MNISDLKQCKINSRFGAEMFTFSILYRMADEDKETFAKEAPTEDIDLEEVPLEDLPL